MERSMMQRWGFAAWLLSCPVLCFGEEAPHDAQQHFREGLAYQQAGKLDEAISAYQQGTALDPAAHNAFFNLGLIYYARKQWPETIEAF